MPKTVAELATHRLIHLEEPYREAASWDEWFQSAGGSLDNTARGLRINDYGLVIQGVMEGQGIALGWRHLAERLLATGLLVPVTDHVLKTGKAFLCRLAEEPRVQRQCAQGQGLAGGAGLSSVCRLGRRWCSTAPPSGLPAISPTCGEIRRRVRFRQSPTSQENSRRKAADLPPRGGDVRQDRGGREGSLAVANSHSTPPPTPSNPPIVPPCPFASFPKR